MSKAFDTVNRKVLLEKLESFLNDSEMRMLHLLIKDVNLKVRLGKIFGETINTNIGVAQWDFL